MTKNDLKLLKEEIDKPILIGSGINKENANLFLEHCDGVIVGTSLKEAGMTNNPISKDRVIQFVKSLNY